MKKMLLISNMYPSQRFPSYGTFVKIFHEQASEIFDVKLLCLYKTPSKLKKLILYILFYCKIIYCILFRKYDVVYIHYISLVALPLLICKKIKRFKLYVNVHGSDIVPETSVGKKLLKYTQKILRMAKKIIVPSSYFSDLLVREYEILKENLYVYPSGGINHKVFYPVDIENRNIICEELNINADFSYWVYASRIDVGKGWDVLIESLHSLNNSDKSFFEKNKIIMIGSGRFEKELHDKIEEYQLSEIIIRIGLLEQKVLAKYYQIAKWFIFPTLRKGESLGLVALEAMACGAPVIATNYAGPTTYVSEGKNGFLFEKGSSTDLVNKILKAYSLDEHIYGDFRNGAMSTASLYLTQNIQLKFKGIFK